MKLLRLLKSKGSPDLKFVFIELVLIVAGILIAFWIDTSWQNRENKKLETIALQSMETEIQEVTSEYRERLEVLNRDIQSSLNLLAVIEGGPDGISNDSLNAYIHNIAPVDRFYPKRASLDDISNSQGLSIFSSDIIRRAISTYTRALDQDINTQQQIIPEIQDLTHSSLEDILDFSEVYSTLDIAGKKEEVRIPDQPFNSDYEEIFSRDFSNFLIYRIQLVNGLIRFHREVINEANLLDILIQSELNEDQSPNEFRG